MSEIQEERAGPSGRVLVVGLMLGVLWAAWGLALHPAFQPAPLLRVTAPIVALFIGGGFARAVARLRARVDGEREFDRGGKALFMGFVMVGATLVAWLLVSQAMPATLNVAIGHAVEEAGTVARKVPASTDVDCRFRLEVSSAAKESGAVPRPLDECVHESVWSTAAEGGPVTLKLVRSLAGAELVAVEAAGASH